MTTGVFKFFAQAVASLQSDGWTMAFGDINTYVRGPAKARARQTDARRLQDSLFEKAE